MSKLGKIFNRYKDFQCVNFPQNFLQVHKLILDYNRQDITVWGNVQDKINAKLYKKVI